MHANVNSVSVLYIPNDSWVPEAVRILCNTSASYTGKTRVTQTDLHVSHDPLPEITHL